MLSLLVAPVVMLLVVQCFVDTAEWKYEEVEYQVRCTLSFYIYIHVLLYRGDIHTNGFAIQYVILTAPLGKY